MALIGNPVLVEVRPEPEKRTVPSVIGFIFQTRTNTTRVYECDCTTATDEIADPEDGGEIGPRSNVWKDKGNRIRRAQLVTIEYGEWESVLS